MRVCTWLVLVTGCGRIGFDLTGDDSPGGGRDGGSEIAGDAVVDGPPVAQIPGLILWYPFDEGSFQTGAPDASGGNHLAQCVPCPTPATGKVGGAASFDGTNQYFVTLYDPGLQTPSGFTVAAFVNPVSLTADVSVLAKPHNATATANTYQLEILGSDAIRFKTRGNATGDQFIVGPNATAGAWQHVAGTWDGSTMRLYVNGAAAGEIAFPDLVVDTNPLLVGADFNGGAPAEEFAGLIDDVRLYNRALTPVEVMSLASQ